MKGIIFCEFLTMVEETYSLEMVDSLIGDGGGLKTGGAYTSVGSYDHQEMLELVQRLGKATGVQTSQLMRTFGEYLLSRFAVLYPAYFVAHDSTFTFLAGIDSQIHMEVKKLYPDARLPKFSYEFPSTDKMILTYESHRPMADLAEGLIQGCIRYFSEPITLSREDVSDFKGTCCRFLLRRGTDAQ